MKLFFRYFTLCSIITIVGWFGFSDMRWDAVAEYPVVSSFFSLYHSLFSSWEISTWKRLESDSTWFATSLTSITNTAILTGTLHPLYAATPSLDVLRSVIVDYISRYEFDQAVRHYRVLLSKDTPHDYRQFVYVLLNSSALSAQTVDSITTSLATYRDTQKLTQDDYTFFITLLRIIKWTTDTRESDFSSLSWIYTPIRDDLADVFRTFRSYPNSPEYYLYSLVGMTLFEHGHIGIARKLAERALISNPRYVLANQIIAYSSVATHQRTQGVDALQTLMMSDTPQSDYYHYLLGISYYYLDKYPDSILQFQQVVAPEYATDVLRYLSLNYRALDDINNLVATLSWLMLADDVGPFDMAHFFDLTFYNQLTPTSSWWLIAGWKSDPFISRSTDLIRRTTARCHTLFDVTHPGVCIYGDVGNLLLADNYTGALPLLQQVAQYYPSATVFATLADVYGLLGNASQAQHYYTQALVQYPSSDYQFYLQTQLQERIGLTSSSLIGTTKK